MALSVNSAFKEFNDETVNLLSERSKKAKSSRDWLYTQLNNLPNKDGLDFPYKYEVMHINYGSFQRKTKIRELDDVDLMYCFTADGATYTKYTNSNVYTILTPDAGKRLKNLSDDNILNSRRVVNKVKNSLSGIEHYKSADLHSRGEAATLDLTSYEWVFDIVPCFYTDTGIYLIPDGDGNWKPTDPRVDQKRVSDANNSHNGKGLQLIRTLKYWNRRNSSHTISSYLFENIVVNFINSSTSLSDYIDYNMKNFFDYLSTAIYYEVNDPKGFQGNLNYLTLNEKKSISDKATWAFNKAKEAIYAEMTEKDVEKSLNKWREIFGSNLPCYG